MPRTEKRSWLPGELQEWYRNFSPSKQAPHSQHSSTAPSAAQNSWLSPVTGWYVWHGPWPTLKALRPTHGIALVGRGQSPPGADDRTGGDGLGAGGGSGGGRLGGGGIGGIALRLTQYRPSHAHSTAGTRVLQSASV